MPVLTDLTSAAVKANVRVLYGNTLTRPELLVTDGLVLTYACDVNIGPVDPTGRIQQLIDNKNGPPAVVTDLPGQPSFDLGDELLVSTILRNVVIAKNNQELIYADVGTPVELRRSDSGQWQIEGLSIEGPGTYHLVPVTIPDILLGPVDAYTLPIYPDIVPPLGGSPLEIPTGGGIIPGVPPVIIIGEDEDLSLYTRLLTLGEFGTFAPFGTYKFGASGIWFGSVLVRVV